MMKKLAAWLLLPPIVVAVPWLLAAIQRRWLSAGVLLVLWFAAYAVMFKLWAGVGFVALVLLGLGVAFTSKIEFGRTENSF